MDSALPAAIAALVGLPAGWLAASLQHHAYREPAYRAQPLAGRWGRAARPAVAIALSLTFGLAFRPDHYDPGTAALTALFCAVLVVLSSTDFERRRIPNRIIYPAMLAAVFAAPFWPDRSVTDLAIGAAVAAAVAALMVLVGAGLGAAVGARVTAFGMGDAKLILLMGMLLGWPAIFRVLFLGVILGGVPALVLLLRGRAKVAYSYGPWLAAAAVAGLLWFDNFAG